MISKNAFYHNVFLHRIYIHVLYCLFQSFDPFGIMEHAEDI